ncbi:Jag N-terminal domain-containing protein [Sulfurimonas sp.]|uniref:Jag N-terminal domain-containing protein n=1 Tax=Sulfurimonas sp. TaxID=2022749 RepID=UPI002A36E8D8|nr:Jag N-terminal domain-containing protein [Sulfurimonas sp.]MDY0123614.1 Jag N-terminal domain-containing protein [Sulfurimonas sp.]
MIKIESTTLEQACKDAAAALECSASELMIEIVQSPSNGFMGLFKKSAIIVAAKKKPETKSVDEKPLKKEKQEQRPKDRTVQKAEQKKDSNKPSQNIINDTIMPESFVSMQEDEDYDMEDINYTADYEEDEEKKQESSARAVSAYEVAKKVEKEINELFGLICFKIDKIEVSAYDEDTLLVEFKGEDAALLIGKEGYRYKALSYMIFNWINTKYQLQLRLEIAEFLKNQEESVARYLSAVYENVERDGRAQTKILDGVLIQIALKELREKYPNKYVAVRSTRDGLKFIIINDYHN